PPAPGNLANWQESATSFESISGYTTQAMTLATDTPGFEPQRLIACACSSNLFITLGVAPFAGRPFAADEDRFGAPRVAVVSHGLWERDLGADAHAVGRGIRLNDQDYEVIAVMPKTFAFPSRTVDVWVPLRTQLPPPLWQRHDLHFLRRLAASAPVSRSTGRSRKSTRFQRRTRPPIRRSLR